MLSKELFLNISDCYSGIDNMSLGFHSMNSWDKIIIIVEKDWEEEEKKRTETTQKCY